MGKLSAVYEYNSSGKVRHIYHYIEMYNDPSIRTDFYYRNGRLSYSNHYDINEAIAGVNYSYKYEYDEQGRLIKEQFGNPILNNVSASVYGLRVPDYDREII